MAIDVNNSLWSRPHDSLMLLAARGWSRATLKLRREIVDESLPLDHPARDIVLVDESIPTPTVIRLQISS